MNACEREPFGLAVRREADKQRDLGSNPLRLSFLFQKKKKKKNVVCRQCFVTLSSQLMKH